jgi:hypothetical protein
MLKYKASWFNQRWGEKVMDHWMGGEGKGL